MSRQKEVINEKVFDELFNTSLSEKEKNFILYYLESYNATQSYLKAYGGEKKNAGLLAFQLLQRKDIRAQIKKLKKILQIGYDVDPSKYIEFLLKAANADIGDYITFSEEDVPQLDKDGSVLIDPDTGEPVTKKINKMHLVNSKNIDTSVIVGIKQGRDGITLQMVDKLKCWEKIKDYFEWKMKQEETTESNNNIIEVLNKSAKSVWDKGNVDDDLEETLNA